VKQKGKAVQLKQGAVTDLITHLANLPGREKSPDDPISLPEIFRSKEYMAEIRGALKRGYTFEDLSKIFTEKCGVSISVRQLKYHYTRGKSKLPKERHSSAKPPKKENAVSTKSTEKTALNDTKNSRGKEAVSDSMSVKSGSFSIDMQQEEI
jgi:hypothetical protein